MSRSLSPVGHGRGSTTFSRRRWLAAAGASCFAAAVGCEPAPGSNADRTAASGTAHGGESTAAPAEPPPFVGDPVLGRACDYLWSKQARTPVGGQFLVPVAGRSLPRSQDGSWRSEKYAQLKGGPALSAMVYSALVRTHSEIVRCPIFALMAEHFLERSIDQEGAVGRGDPELLEYPNYATALTLSCRLRRRDETDRLRERMTAYLLSQQYCEANGFGPDHACYGGWGFGGSRPVGGSPGHMDVGHTRHVLEALRAAGHDDRQTYARAEQFLSRMQKRDTPGFDGGFYFSPIVLAANKGGVETIAGTSYFRSYATATCDGVLALLACGVPRDDERVRAAADWLRKHPQLDYPGGVPADTDENWRASIRFYHFAVRAECYAALDWPGLWREELHDILARLQEPDGSFINREGFLMKEDDPILCTALAVAALADCESRGSSIPDLRCRPPAHVK